jgi:predicted metal-dependent HD superfamily phosphohydrolase
VKQAYHAENPVDAQLALDLLAGEGIVAHVQGSFLSGAVGELPAGELLRLWVADEDLARAKQLLAGRARGDAALAPDEADPLLARSWERAWRGLEAQGAGEQLREELLAAWAQPQRRYHTQRHLRDGIALLEPVLALAQRPAEVEMGWWFHDAIYDPRAGDNERRSADWAESALARGGVDPHARARIDALVMATRHAAEPADTDQALLVDVDLAILGAVPERFDEYEVEIREEYAWVPAPVFRHKRGEMLRSFLARPAIYATPVLRERFEAQARTNLARALDGLKPWWRLW